MTVLRLSHPEPRYTGLAADSKPTPDSPGATFFETDTGATYLYTGVSVGWVQQSAGVPLLATFTIAENGDASNAVLAAVYAQYRTVSIIADDTALTGTVAVEAYQLASKSIGSDASWSTVQSPPGTDVVVAAQKCIVLLASNFLALRMKSGSAELNADKVFYLYGNWS